MTLDLNVKCVSFFMCSLYHCGKLESQLANISIIMFHTSENMWACLPLLLNCIATSQAGVTLSEDWRRKKIAGWFGDHMSCPLEKVCQMPLEKTARKRLFTAIRAIMASAASWPILSFCLVPYLHVSTFQVWTLNMATLLMSNILTIWCEHLPSSMSYLASLVTPRKQWHGCTARGVPTVDHIWQGCLAGAQHFRNLGVMYWCNHVPSPVSPSPGNLPSFTMILNAKSLPFFSDLWT